MKNIEAWIHEELWNQVPTAISVIDRDFRIVDANHSFEHSYGDWRDRRCYAVYKGRTERCERCAAAETFADGQVRVREEEGVVRNGQQSYYLVHLVPLVLPDGEIPYVFEMSTDITANKILEAEKLEAERLAAVGQTVAGLAHGIKNLLMGLEGGVYVFNSGMQKSDSDRMMRGWQMLDENISRISAFVKEFLEFAKGKTPNVGLVRPNQVARDVIDLFRDKAALAGISLKENLANKVSYALMDEDGIHTCLVNLVSNALDACEISDKPNRNVTVTTKEEGGTLVFEVSDDGAGMDYEVKKRVFTKFFSTKGSDRGTGLGLLTTRKIVQEHGGSVSFVSTEGEGSVFRMEFPRDRLPKPRQDSETREEREGQLDKTGGDSHAAS
jgi:PAS domain S-box-containing protein